MRIVHIQMAPFDHGSYKSFTMYPLSEAELGMDVRVIACNSETGGGRVVRGRRLVVENVATRSLSNFSLSPLRFLWGSLRVLRRWQQEGWVADLVHLYTSWAWGMMPALYRGGIDRRTSFLYDTRSRSTRVARLTWLSDWVQAWVGRSCDDRLAIGAELGEAVFGRRGLSWHLAPIGIEPAMLRTGEESREECRRRLGLPVDTLLLLFHGHLRVAKGILQLLDEFDLFLRTCPEEKEACLLLVGDGRELERIKGHAGRLGCGGRVLFRQRVEARQIPFYLAAADVGISYLPREGHLDVQPPLKTLEFMAAGIPVVATASKENERLLANYPGKVLVWERGAGGFAEGLKAMCESLRDRVAGETPGEGAMTAWTWENVVKEYLLPVYEQLSGAGSRVSRMRNGL